MSKEPEMNAEELNGKKVLNTRADDVERWEEAVQRNVERMFEIIRANLIIQGMDHKISIEQLKEYQTKDLIEMCARQEVWLEAREYARLGEAPPALSLKEKHEWYEELKDSGAV